MTQATPVPVPTIRYLTEGKVAEITGLSLSKLRQDRFNRRGLPYVKFGKTVRYSQEDVIASMEAHKINPAN